VCAPAGVEAAQVCSEAFGQGANSMCRTDRGIHEQLDELQVCNATPGLRHGIGKLVIAFKHAADDGRNRILHADMGGGVVADQQ
jgi:hypothetical protein